MFWQSLLSLVFNPTCDFLFGLKWYLVLEMPSLILLAALAYVIARHVKHKMWMALIFLAFIFGFGLINIFDLLNQPTMSFLHPTVGYFPGPLYDEWIPITSGVILARMFSIALAIVLILSSYAPKYAWLTGLVLSAFIFRTHLGWVNTHQSLQRLMPKHFKSQYVDVFSESLELKPHQLASLDHYIHQISQTLNLQLPTQRIRMYLYENPENKKRWTGTHYTMIGNPRQRAMHILGFSTWSTLLVHELTHVIAKPMKKNLLSIPINPLLAEGLAMYIQGHRGMYTLDQWAKAIAKFRKTKDKDTTLDMLNGLDAFYQVPSSHAYLLAGSWTQFLIERYGLSAYKQYYAGQSTQKTFGQSSVELQTQWLAHLDALKLDDTDYQAMAKRLDQKSVFEATCPHEVAHAQVQAQTCANETCKKNWIAFGKACNPNWRYHQAKQKQSPKDKLQNLLSQRPDSRQAKDMYTYHLKLAIAYEDTNQLDQALTQAQQSQQHTNTLMIQRQIKRLKTLTK